MGVTVIKNSRPRIICGLVIPNAISKLFFAVPDRERAEEIIRDSFNLKPNRLFTIVEAISNNQNISILVIYDKIIESNSRYKYLEQMEVNHFNYKIFEYQKGIFDNMEMVLEELKRKEDNE